MLNDTDFDGFEKVLRVLCSVTMPVAMVTCAHAKPSVTGQRQLITMSAHNETAATHCHDNSLTKIAARQVTRTSPARKATHISGQFVAESADNGHC